MAWSKDCTRTAWLACDVGDACMWLHVVTADALQKIPFECAQTAGAGDRMTHGMRLASMLQFT